jgi:hypothetical protein
MLFDWFFSELFFFRERSALYPRILNLKLIEARLNLECGDILKIFLGKKNL